MDCIIVDPNNYDKKKVYKDAVRYCNKFLRINGLSKPNKYLTTAPWLKQRYYGWYQTGTQEVFVDLERSHCPVRNPNYVWSYTGYKVDLTAPGTLAHEIGHHVQTVYESLLTQREKRNFRSILKKISFAEKSMSSYEYDVHEMFAESTRLFLLNPDLLKKARPLRYELLSEVVGLKPMHQVDWREILQHAHPKIIQATEKWLKIS